MKIKVEEKFRPITVTIQSLDEARDLFAALSMTTIHGAREKMLQIRLGDHGIDGYSVDIIWRALAPVVGYDQMGGDQ